MCEFAIRCDGVDFIKIALLGRSHLDVSDYWDGNWVKAFIEVHAGGFRGSVVADLRAEELERFLDELQRLQNTLRGTALFETMERWLTIRATVADIWSSNVLFRTNQASAIRSVLHLPLTRHILN